jgi:hypothetical protein
MITNILQTLFSLKGNDEKLTAMIAIGSYGRIEAFECVELNTIEEDNIDPFFERYNKHLCILLDVNQKWIEIRQARANITENMHGKRLPSLQLDKYELAMFIAAKILRHTTDDFEIGECRFFYPTFEYSDLLNTDSLPENDPYYWLASREDGSEPKDCSIELKRIFDFYNAKY